ncbi:hypothetical protein BD289DRAFT_478762 [Coniella lustricola]|uniref:Uncharacterized protein n=1 Tax=Coniella lustricola TaxID=2025994 RepID=A0A2T3ALR6_9PEZI|nr:hypothetical protein BD289DRAFT_478762 [Coniella lustricola]
MASDHRSLHIVVGRTKGPRRWAPTLLLSLLSVMATSEIRAAGISPLENIT